MNIERKKWFKAGVAVLTFATAFGLFHLAGQWPFGGRSLWSVVIFLFCLVGLQRLYDGIIGACFISSHAFRGASEAGVSPMPLTTAVEQRRHKEMKIDNAETLIRRFGRVINR
jgi:hypothetical protein